MKCPFKFKNKPWYYGRRKNKCAKSNNIGGFFTYMALIIGTILLLFWSALSDEMNIIVGITHDEVALTAMNYKAEGIIGCLLRKYSEKGDLMPTLQETIYENDDNYTASYILNRQASNNEFKVRYRNRITGQIVQYLVVFREDPGPWPKNINVDLVRFF